MILECENLLICLHTQDFAMVSDLPHHSERLHYPFKPCPHWRL